MGSKGDTYIPFMGHTNSYLKAEPTKNQALNAILKSLNSKKRNFIFSNNIKQDRSLILRQRTTVLQITSFREVLISLCFSANI